MNQSGQPKKKAKTTEQQTKCKTKQSLQQNKKPYTTNQFSTNQNAHTYCIYTKQTKHNKSQQSLSNAFFITFTTHKKNFSKDKNKNKTRQNTPLNTILTFYTTYSKIKPSVEHNTITNKPKRTKTKKHAKSLLLSKKKIFVFRFFSCCCYFL